MRARRNRVLPRYYAAWVVLVRGKRLLRITRIRRRDPSALRKRVILLAQ